MRGKLAVVAEDEKHMRDLITKILINTYDYQVYYAEDGDLAYHFIKTMEPNIVFLDLGLPKMSGIEVIERMRSRRSLKNVPVAVMTVSRDIEDIRTIIKLGVADYLYKPDVVDFEEAIGQSIKTARMWKENKDASGPRPINGIWNRIFNTVRA